MLSLLVGVRVGPWVRLSRKGGPEAQMGWGDQLAEWFWFGLIFLNN